ncbi:hypothetical protein P4O66_012571, partial [Electrophorus voltai]
VARAPGDSGMTAADALATELYLLKWAQIGSFPEELDALSMNKRKTQDLDPDAILPIVLDSKHCHTAAYSEIR